MSELHGAGAALGVAASIAIATGAFAVESAQPGRQPAPEAAKAEQLVSDGVPAKAPADPSCPKVALAPDGDAFPKAGDDFKATLQALARDCANLGAETILKVSLVGEGERSSQDGPSWFNAPIRLVVKDAEGRPIETRRIPLKITLPSGALKASFDYTEQDVSLPAADGGYAGWSVTVGFDPAQARAEAAPQRPVKTKRVAAVRRAKHLAQVARAEQAPAPTPPQSPTTTAAIPQPSNNDSPWQKIARSFSERQQARAIEQARQAQAAAKAQQAQPAGRPQLQARPQPQPQPQQAQARPQPRPAAAQQPQAKATKTNADSLRTAERAE